MSNSDNYNNELTNDNSGESKNVVLELSLIHICVEYSIIVVEGIA